MATSKTESLTSLRALSIALLCLCAVAVTLIKTNIIKEIYFAAVFLIASFSFTAVFYDSYRSKGINIVGVKYTKDSNAIIYYFHLVLYATVAIHFFVEFIKSLY